MHAVGVHSPQTSPVLQPVWWVIACCEIIFSLKGYRVLLQGFLQCLGLRREGVVINQEPAELRHSEQLSWCTFDSHLGVAWQRWLALQGEQMFSSSKGIEFNQSAVQTGSCRIATGDLRPGWHDKDTQLSRISWHM